MFRYTLILLASMVLALPAGAQELAISSLARGTRIRVRGPAGPPQTGTLVGIQDGTLRWNPDGMPRTEGPEVTPLASIDRLERSLGQQSRPMKTILLTSSGLGAVFAVVGALTVKDESGGCGNHDNPFSSPCSDAPVFGAAAGAATGVLLGIPLGLVIAKVRKGEGWEPVAVASPRAGLQLNPGGGIGVTFSLPLRR